MREKYDTLEAERNFYFQQVKEYKNGNSFTNKIGIDNIGADIKKFEEEIDTIMILVNDKEDQIKYYISENNKLKEKILTSETELKLKEKELDEVKELYEDFKREQVSKMTTLNSFVLKSINLEQNISDLEIKLKKKEYKLMKEIEELQYKIEENKRILESKEKTIETLNNDINSYMGIVNQKDFKIQELKNEIKNKEREITELINERNRQINKNDEISSELNLAKSNFIDATSKLKIKDNELNDYKRQGRNIFDNYEKQIEAYKGRLKDSENKYNLSIEENRNLNKIIEELKNERQNIETQYFKYNLKL